MTQRQASLTVFISMEASERERFVPLIITYSFVLADSWLFVVQGVPGLSVVYLACILIEPSSRRTEPLSIGFSMM